MAPTSTPPPPTLTSLKLSYPAECVLLVTMSVTLFLTFRACRSPQAPRDAFLNLSYDNLSVVRRRWEYEGKGTWTRISSLHVTLAKKVGIWPSSPSKNQELLVILRNIMEASSHFCFVHLNATGSVHSGSCYPDSCMLPLKAGSHKYMMHRLHW